MCREIADTAKQDKDAGRQQAKLEEMAEGWSEAVGASLFQRLH